MQEEKIPLIVSVEEKQLSEAEVKAEPAKAADSKQPKKEQPATQAAKPQQKAEKPVTEQRKKDRTNVRVVDTRGSVEADLSKYDECVRVYEETKDIQIDMLINNSHYGYMTP